MHDWVEKNLFLAVIADQELIYSRISGFTKKRDR